MCTLLPFGRGGSPCGTWPTGMSVSLLMSIMKCAPFSFAPVQGNATSKRELARQIQRVAIITLGRGPVFSTLRASRDLDASQDRSPLTMQNENSADSVTWYAELYEEARET